MKQLLIFIHYNKNNKLADYIIYTLKNIKHLFKKIIFISNSQLSEENKLKLNGLYDIIKIRDNKGFDFGAWKDALLNEGWKNIISYDNITLMNDTCFGPLYDIKIIYDKMNKNNIDFWGLTEQIATNTGMPGTDDPVPAHIQSYFMFFNNKIINSNIFQNFWNNVLYEETVEIVIQKYETQLTNILINNGFNCEAFFKAEGITNLSIFNPDLCIINSVPFIKIKSFLYFQDIDIIKKLLQEMTNYPFSLITDHYFNIYKPSDTYLLIYKNELNKKIRELEETRDYINGINEILNNKNEELKNNINELENSKNFKIGKIILFFPRLVKNIFKKIININKKNTDKDDNNVKN